MWLVERRHGSFGAVERREMNRWRERGERRKQSKSESEGKCESKRKRKQELRKDRKL
jgi:hypothetical protein